MNARWTLVAVFGVGAVALSSGTVFATQPAPGVTTTILAKSTVDPLNINVKSELNINATTEQESESERAWRAILKTHGVSDFYVVDNKLTPGADTGWHSHAGPSFIFVVAGTVTNYESTGQGCTKNVYTQGSNFIDTGGLDEHILRNEGAVQAETIAVQMLPHGAVRRIDKAAPVNCAH